MKLNNTQKLIAVLIYIVIVSVLFMSSSSSNIGFELENPQVLLFMKFLQVLSVALVFILPAILFSVFFTDEKFAFLQMGSKPNSLVLTIGGLIMFIALPGINVLSEINGALTLPESLQSIESWMKISEANAKLLTESFLKMNGIGDLILNLIVIALFAALSEEIFFRGVVQKVVMSSIKNPHIAIWIAALLFSALHGQFYGFLPRMLLGAVLGYLFFWSGSLWVPIFAHFINNGAAVLISFLIQKGIVSDSVETIGTGSMQWVFLAISIMGVLGLLLIVKKLSQKEIELQITSN